MGEFEEYITGKGLVEFAGWCFKKDECDEYMHEPTQVASHIWVDKEHVIKNQQSKIEQLEKVNAKNQNTLQHLECEYLRAVAENKALRGES